VPLFWITGGNYCFTFIDLLVGIGGIRLGFESLVANVFSQANGTIGQKKIHPVDA
jgi:hypothetical protein